MEVPSERERIGAAHFVLAVREKHDPLAEATLRARVHLAHAYAEAGRHGCAADLLDEALIDAGRIFGPVDERTLRMRLRLGNERTANGEPVMALTVLLTLELEISDGDDSGPMAEAVRASARAALVVALADGHLDANHLEESVPRWCLPG